MLPEGLPEFTLGWDILDWGTAMLAHPEEPSQPWVYTNEQARFILWFYAVDRFGRFRYKSAVLERPKGWGKSPFLGAICITEFMGPTQFAGWDAQGNPVGRPTPAPLVQIAAISDSAAENTYSAAREMMLNGPIIDEFPQLEVMLAKSQHPGNRKLEKVTASPRGREGNRASFCVMDETWNWIPAEQGPELYRAITKNLAKRGYRWVETTNAPVPGHGSVAEFSHEAYEKILSGESEFNNLLFDTREVVIDDIYDKEKAIPALQYLYGDSTEYVDIEYNIWPQVNDPRADEHDTRRAFFNQRERPQSAWLNYNQWVNCREPRIKLRTGDKIALGFKGTTNRSAAVLVGVRLEDGALFNLGFWEIPKDARMQYRKTNGKTADEINWEAPWDEIDARVRNVMAHYDVQKLLADPVNRRDMVSKWYADFPNVVEEYWLSNKGKFARAVQQFERMVEAGKIQWNSGDISRHILNAYTEEITGGQHIIRQDTPHSTRFISGAQAAVIAVEAAYLAIADGGLSSRELFSY